MSGKTDLELQASPSMSKLALEQKDASPQPPQKERSLRSRLWKALYIIECLYMASALHGYAIAHAQQDHRARWDEVMIPDVQNLVEWIKLFVSTSSERIVPWMNSTAFFFIALANFVCYACWYFASNSETDRFQRHVLASVAGVGYIVALSLGFGPMISTFCVAPRAVIVGLLVGDMVHLVFPGLQWRAEDPASGEVGSVVDEKA